MSDQFETVGEVVDLYVDMNENSNRVWAIETSCREDLSVYEGNDHSDDETTTSSSNGSK